MFEAPAIKLALELALDIPRQCSSLRRQVGVERGVMFFDKLIKEGTFRAMAFIDRRSNARTGFPASRQRQQHARILAKSSWRLALTGPLAVVAARAALGGAGRKYR